MNLAQALEFYRSSLSPGEAAGIAEFRAMPIADQMELLMHMLQHTTRAASLAIARTGGGMEDLGVDVPDGGATRQ